MSPRKKPSLNQETNVDDKITELPNAILDRILSCVPTFYVVRTSVLSKRFRNLWFSMQSLDFDQDVFLIPSHLIGRKKYGAINFSKCVDSVLYFRDGSDLMKLRISWSNTYVTGDLNHLNNWIVIAVRHNVQELDLSRSLRLPSCLFICESLRTLVFCNCEIKKLIISSPRLENLTIEYDENYHLDVLEVIAPTLTLFKMSMNCVDYDLPRVCFGENKAFTSKAEIALLGQVQLHYGFIQLLRVLSNLKSMQLFCPDLMFSMYHLKRIEVHGFSGQFNEVGLLKFLLDAAIVLEKAVLLVQGWTMKNYS
ncbi:hypothetical protein GIB67_024571 [Kingdonia uniflora]|uniref:F-box domain-containing protein n=1 Tax=Kingdonia uniflora TaxID=39325 RepID=A0A7J7LPB5_9MAGN|nr:hypothetical protein GIB67_024571 [Kingdonia uniflora]